MRPCAEVDALLATYIHDPSARVSAALAILAEARRRCSAILLRMRGTNFVILLNRMVVGTAHAAAATWIASCNGGRDVFARAPILADVAALLDTADAIIDAPDRGGPGLAQAAVAGGAAAARRARGRAQSAAVRAARSAPGADALALMTSRKRAKQMIAFVRHLQSVVANHESLAQRERERAARSAFQLEGGGEEEEEGEEEEGEEEAEAEESSDEGDAL